jgi:DNA-binding MarR family transcriptional regulator
MDSDGNPSRKLTVVVCANKFGVPLLEHRLAWFALTSDQRAAWAGFLRVHATVTFALDEELQQMHRLSLSEYDVLVQLSVGQDGERRMSELAESVMLSRSGLTRLVERLERAGLAQRRRATDDARATITSITETGLAFLAEATPTHLDGVRRLFLDPIGDSQAGHLARAWSAILEPRRTEQELADTP